VTAAALSQVSCTDRYAAQALTASVTGLGLFLPLMALQRPWSRVAVIALACAATCALAVSLPVGCRLPASASFEPTVYLIGLALVLRWIERVFDTLQADADHLWQVIVAEQEQRVEDETRTEAWKLVDDGTRSLLADIASARLGAGSEETRRLAGEAAQRTRDRLLGDEPGVRIPHSVSMVTRGLPAAPKVVVRGAEHADEPLPEDAASYLAQILGRSGPGAWTWFVTLTGEGQEHVLAGPSMDAQVPVPTVDDQRWSLSVVTTSGQTSVLLRFAKAR
jgi:hypothetical protein